jgi:hypothetical protein
MNNTQCRVKIQNRFSEPINFKSGVRQGDALVCVLFNVALEKVIRDAAVILEVPFVTNSFTFYLMLMILT